MYHEDNICGNLHDTPIGCLLLPSQMLSWSPALLHASHSLVSQEQKLLYISKGREG